MNKGLAVGLIALLYAAPALACSPNAEYFKRPLAERMDMEDFFLGTVSKVTETQVSFTIITPGGPAHKAEAGDTMTLRRGEYGTCGRKDFEVGQTWLYNGHDIALSEATLLEPSDLKDGHDLETVKRHLIARIDPAYKPPREPVKEDLPVPGTYRATQACDQDPAQSRSYKLNISSPNKAGQYKVSLDISGCSPSAACTFVQSAPAYGYGEIVLPLEGVCYVIIQQLSQPQEWSRLQPGETKVILSNPQQCRLPQCADFTSIPVLKKQGHAAKP